MKKLLVIIFCFAYNLSYSSPFALSINLIQKPSCGQMEFVNPGKFNINDIAKMKVKDFEKLSGRKLSLEEKIYFLILKRQLKKNHAFAGSESPGAPGQIAMILGVLAVLLALVPWTAIFAIPLGILAIVKGNQAKKSEIADSKKGKAGKILGFIALGVVVFWLLLLLILLLSFDGGFFSFG